MNNSYIKSVILRICKQPRSFEYISKNLNGLDPIEVSACLKQLEDDDQLVNISELWSIKEVPVNHTLSLYPSEPRLYLQKYMGYFDFLKTPHPLDFEWRNSSFSLNRFISRIISITDPSDKILFLGMPTLFATAIAKDIPNSVSLIERNSPIVQGLRKIITDAEKFKIIEADIFLTPPSHLGDFYCVVMDPPWYTPHFYQFMWLAANVVSIGGMVAISLPPINTRPNMINERMDWFKFCQSVGLCIETIEPQHLQYAMPFFEFNALRAAGINSILPFWRKGDLAIFRKISTDTVDRPANAPSQDQWHEKEYGSSRVRVKLNTHQAPNISETLKIDSIVKGDILPTVSSRDSRRSSANIWTSGNRIFNTNDPVLFWQSLQHVVKQDPIDANQVSVKAFLDKISKLEQSEFKEYLDWIYYEMERQTD